MLSRLRVAAVSAACVSAARRSTSRCVSKSLKSVVMPMQLRSLHSVCAFSRMQMIGNTHVPVRHFSISPVTVPNLGDSITEGTLVKWQKNVGDAVAADEVLVVIETDKVSVDIRSPASGVLTAQKAKEGETIKVGAELGSVDTDAKGAPTSKPAAAASAAPASPAAPSPASHSGEHVKQSQPPQTPASAPVTPPAPAPKATSGSVPPVSNQSVSKPGAAAPGAGGKAPTPITFPPPGTRNTRRVPMSRMRQTIATRLKHAQNTAACLTTFNEIDMTNLMELRNKYKDEFFEKYNIKLGFMSGFVKASAIALQKHPDVNSIIEGTDLVYNDFVDISVAVSTPTGLVVPVLRNVEQMGFAHIEGAIAALGQKARKGQIAMEDMVGGTFTISNGGVYGSLFGTPILNPPQSAILGMHGIFKRPVVVNDKIEIRPMMYVALTYDHRVIDGGTAVTFLKEIKANVEEPQRLLLAL